jgi:hypothetical protein
MTTVGENTPGIRVQSDLRCESVQNDVAMDSTIRALRSTRIRGVNEGWARSVVSGDSDVGAVTGSKRSLGKWEVVAWNDDDNMVMGSRMTGGIRK